MWTRFPLSVANRVDLCFAQNTSKCWNMLKIKPSDAHQGLRSNVGTPLEQLF